MLDLQPSVHLEEVEVAVAVDDELDRAGGVVADRAGQGHGLLAHRSARRLVQERRGRLLDHLLVAPLDRAFALAEMDEVALPVAQHLDLDVARLDHVLLDQDTIVAERGARLGPRALEALEQLLVVMGDPHALAAAAGRGLDHHRVADAARDLEGGGGVGDRVEGARHGRDLGQPGQPLALDLVAHGLDRAHGRPDEGDPRLAQRLGEGRALGRGSRSQDGRPRHRSGGRPRRSGRPGDSSAPPAAGPAAPSRRPAARGARRRRPRSRRPPWRCRACGRCG